METIRTVVSETICTGCEACRNACPVDAIAMCPNVEGFNMPDVDFTKCIGCGKCIEVCPVLKFENNNEIEKSEVYAAMASDEIRMVSSSGGMFTLLAEYVLMDGGVVCGAAYDKNLHVNHVFIQNSSELYKLRGSKYVQSDINLSYRKTEKYLKNNIKVLFTGTPCQVAALYNYLGKEYDNLYTMDLLCHGVPSPKVLEKYLNETFGEHRKDIVRFDFRDKSVFGWSTCINVYFADGTEFHRDCKDDPYYQAFLPIVSIRQSCASCKFSTLPRVADISVGDFWGIEKNDSECSDKNGTSLVVVNSSKGSEFFRKISNKMKKYKATPIEWAYSGNPTLKFPFRSHPARERFFRDLDLKPLSELVKKAKKFQYDIGIVGLWYGLNYGSILTYYALYHTVRSMGFDALMINKPEFLWNDRYTNRNSVANRFIYKNCNVSNIRKGKYGWNDLNNFCDTFIVGSDIVWNYQICGKESGQFFFLDFVEDIKKKIAMASSFGSGYDAPEYERILSKYYLEKFDYVGVREEEAVHICKDKFGIEADKVMDPVFLCDKKVYDTLAETAVHKESEPFISGYILGPNAEKASVLRQVSKIKEIPLRVIPNPNEPERFAPYTGLTPLLNQSVEDWLYHIKKSEFFVGDSFHGLCFALIFEKPFLITVNSQDKSLCRFTSLLKLVGLEHRLMFTDKDNFEDKKNILNEKIDYDVVRKILITQAAESREWLYNALTSDKCKTLYSQDLIISKLFERIGMLEQSNENIKKQLLELKEKE